MHTHHDSFVLSLFAPLQQVDYGTLLPDNWPNETGSRAGKADKMEAFVKWLQGREETRVAVVCHHNVISALIGKSAEIKNAVPIRCILDEGRLRVVR